ncbi:rRNA biogenesis protein rrp36 [Conoideocrella luteorostrata]|uniref:rRNA biogenesis protein RRP36 n=1 Tax=Conoideocrella luteorostrata TaxID=1105319 RepID=A0AAJ0G1J0_9HYPO|nr:rRNA biogenesis protein rrp36 [Conoideocrella luteorostrata]
MPLKRKLPSLGLERRVRPRREEKWEPEPDSDSDLSEGDGAVEGRIDHAESDDEEDEQDGSDEDQSDPDDSEDDNDDDDDDDEIPPKVDLSSVSFGVLARAQSSIHKSKSSQPSDGQEQQQPAFLKDASKPPKKGPKPKRSSKHAPQEQTSKRPVTRMREIIPDTRRKARDPRFDPTIVGKVDEGKARKAYAFLDEYRESEMADLRGQIKKTKNSYEKENLKRKLMSMESKKKAQKKKDEEERLLAEHRQKEKELVEQGKTPFYLKKSEQKKQLLTNRYDKMSKGQVDRAIERKRKKVVGREKKELDQLVRRR